MSYLQQVFKDGDTLFASDLNLMSEGIASKQDRLDKSNSKTINGTAIFGAGDIIIPDAKFTPELVSGVEKQYISKESLKNVSHDTFNINKYAVSVGDTISIKARIGGAACCAWVDSSGTRSIALTGNSDAGLNIDTTLTVPSGAIYLEVSYSTTESLTIFVGADSVSNSSYEKEPSQFNGLKIGILGDSIAANGGFFSKLRSELKASSGNNVAVGGWVYAEDTGVGGEYPNDANHGIYRQVENLTGDEKLIILWAGTNDFGHSHIIGESFTTDEGGIRHPITDPSTFYGGLHRVIQELYAKFEYVPIVFCTPLQRVITSGNGYPENSRDCNKVSKYLEDYADAIRNVAAFYSIPVFESGTMTNLDPNNSYIYSAYFDDGLHPNSAGHALIGKALAKFIENHLYMPIK